MKNSMNLMMVMTLACGAPGAWAQQAQSSTEEAQRKAYMEMMRKDVRKDLHALVDDAMGLDAADKAKFWEAYTPYETEMKGIWDRRLANMKKYAENFNNITPAMAEELAAAGQANEQDTLAARKRAYERMKTALGPVVAARFLQVETTIGHLVGLQIGSEIPLIQ